MALLVSTSLRMGLVKSAGAIDNVWSSAATLRAQSGFLMHAFGIGDVGSSSMSPVFGITFLNVNGRCADSGVRPMTEHANCLSRYSLA